MEQRREKYKGRQELELKWRSFAAGSANPITISWLTNRAAQAGADVATIMMLGKDEFEECDFEVLEADDHVANEHPFSRFLLNGNSEAMANELKDVSFVMDQIALSGQLTVIFAPPNTGKTLVTLHCIKQAIDQGWIEASDVFYVNVDDTAHGLVEKVRIGEESGFGMLCDGYNGFNVNEFAKYIDDLSRSGAAGRTIIILDTAKKFTNLMDKGVVSRFNTMLRKFATQGGTVIALAHTNKHPREGKGVPGGTSDVLDDFDCGYVIDPVSDDGCRRVVEFRNVKSRGPVAKAVAFSYSTQPGVGYRDLLDSVEMVEQENLAEARQATRRQADNARIDAITSCIKSGIITKMEIKSEASRRASCSHHQIVSVIDKYTGDDPATHMWNFQSGPHGRKLYFLLQQPDDGAPDIPMDDED